jgi:DNA-binding transcriptional ArsR family regulator
MGKTFETKKKILDLLKKKKMTVTEISEELNLSHATVSQHISELQKSGAIEKIDNEHYKKMTYYKVSDNQNNFLVKYALGVIGILLVIGIVIYLSGIYTNNSLLNKTTQISQTNHSTNLSTENSNTTLKNTTVNIINATPVPISGSYVACPMLFYTSEGAVENHSNYTINGTQNIYKDFVLGKNTSTTFNIKENFSDVLNESEKSLYNRQHYIYMNQVNRAFNSSAVIGVYAKFSSINYTIENNGSIDFNVTIKIGQNATENTYMVHIDGPCGGGVEPFLITIGNKPYSGNITTTAMPFA